MIGKSQIQISGTQFAAGLCTSDYLSDGGIGTSSSNINPVATLGVVRATPVTALTSGAPTVPIIASCESADGNFGEAQRYYLTNTGKFYSSTINDGGGSGFTNLISAASTAGYSANVTDMVPFAGNFYATKTDDVALITPGSPYVFNQNWWTGTKAKAPLSSTDVHPLLVYNDLLWVADGNLLHSISYAGTISLAVLTLNSSERILSLGIDPGTGSMMIGTTTAVYFSAKDSYRSFVYLYDGVAAYPTRKVPVDGQPVSIRYVGGQVFMGIDNTIQVWNGSGTTFLRRLTNALETYSSWPFKMRTTSFNNTYCVVDGVNILAYGDVVNGKKVWYPIAKNNASTNEISFLTFAGYVSQSVTHTNSRPTLVFDTIVSAAEKFYYVSPLDATVAGTGVFYTNNIYFQRPVNIRRIRITTTGITTTTGIGGVAIVDEKGVTTTPTVSTFVVPAAQTPKYVFDFDFNKQVQSLQPKITLDTQAFGIITVIIYYDVVE